MLILLHDLHCDWLIMNFIKILSVCFLTVFWLSVATAKIASNNVQLVEAPQSITKTSPSGSDFIKNKESIVAFLERHGASKTLSQTLWKLPKSKQRWLSGISTSQPIVCYKSNKQFKSCHIIGSTNLISIIRLGDQLSVEKTPLNITKSIDYGSIDIKHSIFKDGRDKGYDAQLLNEINNALRAILQDGKQVRKGDKVSFLFERKQMDHGIEMLGHVTDIVYSGQKQKVHLTRYKGKNKNFYDEQGRSATISFLKYPVHFSHVSSPFSKGRKHPVYGIVKPHHGVDLAAKMLTKIKATAPGRVTFAGTKGGYGKTIIVQHDNDYKTLYAHMHHFAKDISVGKFVHAGDIIGFVGTTGVSTGPHVHYEIRKHNTPIDPLNSVLPRVSKLSAEELKIHRREQAKADMLRLSFSDAS